MLSSAPTTIHAPTPAAADARSDLRAFRPDSPFVALGLAVSHLMTKPAFAKLGFGEWSRILVGQINRKHYCFVIDGKNQVQGFLGWALASKASAEAWAEGRAGVSFQESMQGDCIIFNAWASSGARVNRLLLHEARKAMTGKDTAYFKRHYNDGTTRASRVVVNEFVGQHLERGLD
jgi:hemolysin-activating ACP:hemolysin acyltransferase